MPDMTVTTRLLGKFRIKYPKNPKAHPPFIRSKGKINKFAYTCKIS